ncbi:response regulator transcription factor [Patescibacteria group bacterium]|nr:response regulator transcription factor [Patescibacteria group bacterium]MCG2702206.1 response regulator transcription factor [Candidatus Parcubacteria bacterium]MBU4264780.1 response regulator transcription factor [Patescibacteria group bacterium]MBU4390118.1 response regulator transcription factor [Patescibacteria group bacterium]MBU4396701.1 response regulator transcription factor [Patescibacteria group bacterium]
MRILIIEDEHKIANSIKKGLEQESYAVDVAYDGQYGLDLASTEDYDSIILDLMLPKLSGMQICKQLRQLDVHTPILMLTAKGEIDDKVNGLNAGADDYLVKPFAFAELLARIKALSRRPKNNTGSILSVSDLTLNTITYQVKRGQKNINLSKKEFALLQYFLQHKEQILSKDQIINHVWNYDADVLPNTVEVYVGYLRNKLDKAFKNKKPLIHTIRGFGYKISDKQNV